MNEMFLEILKYGVEQKMSDIHLCTGAHPMFRKNGVLLPNEEFPKLTLADIEDIVKTILKDNQMETLLENKSVDFTFSSRGFVLFRVSI